MPNTSISANMSLPIPVVGTQSGPQYAININDCLTIIDAHDHTSGNGALITAAALDINADLQMGDNNLTLIRSTRFSSQNAALALAADLRCLYVVGQDLFYNDASGNQVRITQNGAVAGTPGSIANLSSPASASYVLASTKFVFQSDVNTAASLDVGPILLRNATANSYALTLQAPTLGANYSVTLPALPAASKIMTIDSSGAIAAVTDADNSTLEIASNLLRVKAGGIASTQMAGGAVILKSQIFTSSGSFTVPAGVTDVLVFGCGAGGGGGSGSISAGGGGGGGGGAGAMAAMYGCSVTPAAVLSVVVGAGGAGGAAVSGTNSNGNAGGAGGNSTFNGLTFKGAAGGGAGTASGGAGGASKIYSPAGGAGGNSGSNGTAGSESWTFSGGAGGSWLGGSAGAGGGGGGAGHGSDGGAGSNGGAFVNSSSSSPGANGAGGGAGGGGSGACNPNAGGVQSVGKGGDGHNGFIIIYWTDKA